MKSLPVMLKVITQNKKLLGCAVTYVAQQSCAQDCRLLGNGCYAETGPMAWTVTAKLNKAGEGLKPFRLAYIERLMIQAAAYDPNARGRPLRLHGVGDCRTDAAAREVAKGAKVWQEVTGGQVWTYTHAWRIVDRKSWGRDIKVLASVEDPKDLGKAWIRGYVPALIVPKFPKGHRAFKVSVKGAKWKVIPCPEQTKGIPCRNCGLCYSEDLWATQSVIGFAAHGAKANAVKETLIQIQGGSK